VILCSLIKDRGNTPTLQPITVSCSCMHRH